MTVQALSVLMIGDIRSFRQEDTTHLPDALFPVLHVVCNFDDHPNIMTLTANQLSGATVLNEPASAKMLQDVRRALSRAQEGYQRWIRIAKEVAAKNLVDPHYKWSKPSPEDPCVGQFPRYYNSEITYVTTNFIDWWVCILAQRLRTMKAARIIQRFWLHAYYTPTHPVCRGRLIRELQCLVSHQS
jgi:hypothetical protein